MQSITVVAWIPIRDTRIDEDGRFHDDMPTLVQVIEEVPDAIRALNQNILSAALSIQKQCPDTLAAIFQPTASFSLLLHSFAQLTIEIAVDDERIKADNPEQHIDEPLIASVAAIFVAETIEKVLLLSELAYPGCVDTRDGLTLVNGRSLNAIKSKSTFASLRFPGSLASGWPPLSNVGFYAVLSWVERAKAFAEGLATTRVQRVMAAYTHIIGLTQFREGEVLFRAIQGIEAFYSEGSSDLRNQLREKIALWLGQWERKTNIIGRLYEARSAFIHGSSPLEYWNNHEDPLPQDLERLLKLTADTDFAVRLLLATLQRCVRDGVVDVRWTYAVDVVR